MIIHLQFGFSQFISFREEDLWNFSQSEHIIGPGSHVEYPAGTKNSNFVEDHPRNIPAKFGSNWPSGFGEEAWNVKSLQTTDDGRQVMAIVHLDLWSRWTKKLWSGEASLRRSESGRGRKNQTKTMSSFVRRGDIIMEHIDFKPDRTTLNIEWLSHFK